MKNKLFFLSIIFLLTFSSCKNEKITCTITSPLEDAKFNEYQTIYVNAEASINKGSIIQVQIIVDNVIRKSYTEKMPSYNDTIKPRTLPLGFHTISAVAYSSEGNSVVAAISIKIEESEKSGE